MNWDLAITLVGVAAIAMVAWQIIKRWRVHAWKRQLSKIEANAKAGKPRAGSLENPDNGAISLTQEGFTVSRYDKVIASVRWKDVEKIRAYKADLFATDLICWGFCRAGDDRMVEVHEEMSGFQDLLKAAETCYGIKGEDWFTKVAFPAFVPNMTVIWTKESGPQSGAPTDSDARTGKR